MIQGQKTYCRPFNMIEIALAFGVIAIGILSIMGLFPIGLEATQNANAQVMASNAANNFMEIFEHNIREDWDGYIVGASRKLPREKRDADNTDIPSDLDVIDNTNDTIYDIGTSDDGLYHILSYVDENADNSFNDDDFVDFRAVVAIWVDNVIIEGSPVDLSTAAAIRCEVSWPARAPLDKRETLDYYLEIFKR